MIAANLLVERKQGDQAFELLTKAIARCELQSLLLPARTLRLRIANHLLARESKNTAPQDQPYFAAMCEDSEYILRYDELTLENADLYESCINVQLNAKAHGTAYDILEANYSRFSDESIRGLVSYLFIILLEAI